MISIESVFEERFPGLAQRQPLLSRTLLSLLRLLFHEREFKQFSAKYPHLEGFDFVEQALDYFEFSFRIRDNERERIPSQGRVVIVANHPIGSLDGLALLKFVGQIRRDVKVVANEILYSLQPLRSLLLPVDNMGGGSSREQIRSIREHLHNEGALIIFPAGEVSRMGPRGIRDGQWNTGFLRFARHSDAPVIPVFVDGRNSLFFYSLSLLAKPVSTLWLIREMFKQARNYVDIHVGHGVYPERYQHLAITPANIAKLFKKQVYHLPRKHGITKEFAAEYEAIAHPENRQLLRNEIQQCELLGYTSDGKRIYLYHYKTDSTILREIGRLRELTFRTVKEGTGRRRDTDRYDGYYDHLVLWDDRELEIAGAYRMRPTRGATLSDSTEPPLYSQTLFQFQKGFEGFLEEGLELGRSFVQPEYWGKRSVDYLWQGIGAYLDKHRDIRYMFGPVSISHAYGDYGKELLIRYYQTYFSGATTLVSPKSPYQPLNDPETVELPNFRGDNQRDEFCVLKSLLKAKGMKVPTLYKQYTELFEPGGVQFLGFNIDKAFADCVDGFILADLQQLKPEKRRRYLSGPFLQSATTRAPRNLQAGAA